MFTHFPDMAAIGFAIRKKTLFSKQVLTNQGDIVIMDSKLAIAKYYLGLSVSNC